MSPRIRSYGHGILYEDLLVHCWGSFLSLLAGVLPLPEVPISGISVQMGALGYSHRCRMVVHVLETPSTDHA